MEERFSTHTCKPSFSKRFPQFHPLVLQNMSDGGGVNGEIQNHPFWKIIERIKEGIIYLGWER